MRHHETGLRVVQYYCTLLYYNRSSGNDRYGHCTPGALLICGRLTRLCGLPPTRPRQTSDPVSRETPITRFSFPSNLRLSIKRHTHIQQASGFLSGHRNVPIRSTISGRVSSGVLRVMDRSVERGWIFDAHFPRFSRKDHHRATSNHSIAFKTTK
jgi:hypothetical protein